MNKWYYYEFLSELDKVAYQQLYEGLIQMKNLIVIHVDAEKVQELIWKVIHDNPQIFYVNLNKFNFTYSLTTCYVQVKYEYTRAMIQNVQRQLDKKIYELKSFMQKEIENDLLTVRYIHNYIVQNVTYDYEHCQYGNTIPENHNVLGAILFQKAVCEGISMATKYFLNYMNIPCGIIIGTLCTEHVTGSHAWNVVYIRGHWYHLDVTLDMADVKSLTMNPNKKIFAMIILIFPQ